MPPGRTEVGRSTSTHTRQRPARGYLIRTVETTIPKEAMHPSTTYTCASCGKTSSFTRRAMRRIVESPPDLQSDETRTYICDHCNAKTRVTMIRARWMTVDARLKANDKQD